ncbi:MAG: M13 family metallopeptidase N-terminal domain-containing protein, partial [Planctomycetota bacterium]
MKKSPAIALCLISALAACASEETHEVHSAAPTPVATAPASGLVLAEMDLKADPATDFYRYVNGGWIDANPVPSDEALWGVFSEVKLRNELVLQQVLEQSASKPSDDLNRKLGDFFASGMDEAAIERAGEQPLSEDLAAIEALTDIKDLPALLARLHSSGTSGLFNVRSNADLTDAT